MKIKYEKNGEIIIEPVKQIVFDKGLMTVCFENSDEHTFQIPENQTPMLGKVVIRESKEDKTIDITNLQLGY